MSRIKATRKGEAFDTTTGRPVSTTRPGQELRWMPFARDYMDMKWPTAAATYRRSLSEALTAVTVAMLDNDPDQPDSKVLRAALHRWAFNCGRRDTLRPADVDGALRWAERSAPSVSQLAEPATLRRVLAGISTRLDGKPGAPTVVNQRRRVLFNIAEYAVERRCIEVNPLPEVKWKAPKSSGQIDRRSVVNPIQARVLLDAVRQTRRSGPRLVAFFALMYFSALRPEEAANVRRANLELPETGWGMVHLDRATPPPDRSGRTAVGRETSGSSSTVAQARAGRCPCRQS